MSKKLILAISSAIIFVTSAAVRAKSTGLTPACFHRAASSLDQCTSRWWVPHRETMNSSLTLRPRARGR
jgi:hypothetical protein